MQKILNIDMEITMAEIISNYTNYYLKVGKKKLTE